MCGIAGYFNPRGIEPNAHLLTAMAEVMAHRGPDHEGFFQDRWCALASRRLAIIDLTDGNQPICHPQTGMVLVFNGEIYNYRELRQELTAKGHIFRTNSDSEVLLTAFVEWGAGCLHRLVGMFAFAVWNPADQRLFLARDRMGKKPLYYSRTPGNTYYFASEIKSILQCPDIHPEMNVSAMDRLLDYGFNLAPSTFFRQVRQIMPGTFLQISARGQVEQSYWNLPVPAQKTAISEQEAAEGLRHHLEEAVRSRLVSDVPVASYLSGGIDSSAVTGLYASFSETPVHSLSITFEDASYDERHFARLVSKSFATNHHEFLCSIAEDEIGKLIWHLEAPMVTLLNLPLYLLSRQIRDMGFKVVLSGDGADEILGGYDYFKLVKLMPFIGRSESPGRVNLLHRVFPALASLSQARQQYSILKTYPTPHPAFPYRFQAFQLKKQLLSDDFLDRIMAHAPDRVDDLPLPPTSADLLNQALYFETKMRLPNLTLPLADTMSMANSVELRSPFMDHRLVEYAFSLPAHLKMRALNEKSLLKKSFQSFLPPAICERRKQPLTPPSKWFVRKFRTMIGDILSPGTLRAKGYFRPECVDLMLKEFDQDSPMDYSGVIIVAVFVHLFDDLFLDPRTRLGC